MGDQLSKDEQAHLTTETIDSQPQQAATSHKRRHSGSHDGSDGRKRSASPSNEDGEITDTDPSTSNPPLPDEEAPPLPDEPLPEHNDGWTFHWDDAQQVYYFYNTITQECTYENPRIPQATTSSYVSSMNDSAVPTTPGAPGTTSASRRPAGGYNPAIHGSYDPNADYAKEIEREEEEQEAIGRAAAGMPDPSQDYSAEAHFNRFSGRFQSSSINSDRHNDENKSRRQMGAFFDVDAAANSHDGKSLKAERRGKSLSKKELKAYKDKRHAKKEEKRRAWLRD